MRVDRPGVEAAVGMAMALAVVVMVEVEGIDQFGLKSMTSLILALDL